MDAKRRNEIIVYFVILTKDGELACFSKFPKYMWCLQFLSTCLNFQTIWTPVILSMYLPSPDEAKTLSKHVPTPHMNKDKRTGKGGSSLPFDREKGNQAPSWNALHWSHRLISQVRGCMLSHSGYLKIIVELCIKLVRRGKLGCLFLILWGAPVDRVSIKANL